jgi:RimJ/RimL family protein N-acetyltransferase
MLNIRRATKEDMMQYFYWANDPEVRAASFYPEQISLSGHQVWFNKIIADTDSFLFVFESDGNLVGQVRIEKRDRTVIGISVDKSFRGRGIAVNMLRMAMERYFEIGSDPVYAYIRKNNLASVKSFGKAGFEYFDEGMVNKQPCFVYVYRQK